MVPASQLLNRIADPSLTHDERARLRCQLAAGLEEAGNFEAAQKALGDLWPGLGSSPVLAGLERETAAEVLLRAGVLTGWLGSLKRVKDAQESAKSLIGSSMAIFEELRLSERMAEAQVELAYCHWRQGAFDKARSLLQESLHRLDGSASKTRAVALLRMAMVERSARRLHDALRHLTEAAPLIEMSAGDILKGRLHNQLAAILENLGRAEHRKDYIDRALTEYAAASQHFEQAGHRGYQACMENNLGYLFSTLRKYGEAHAHLDRASALLDAFKERVHLARLDETRARVLLAEGRATEAERSARGAVQALEEGGEQSLLAGALTTHGVALARLGRTGLARLEFERAEEVAVRAGDPERAGLAALTLLEELGWQLTPQELGDSYARAAELLSSSSNTASRDRLLACSRRVLFLMGALSAPPTWEGFSLMEAVRRFEARLVKRAMRDASGVVTHAAKLLGVTRQNLSNMLHTRHTELLRLRRPSGTGPLSHGGLMQKEAHCVSILYVEDRQEVAEAVGETLELEGWRVESCADGDDALRRIQGDARYDVLIFDYDLPGLNGIELARFANALPHRRQTPVIMLTASDVEPDARRVGVSAFLRKPDDLQRIAGTVARLLARKTEQN